MNIQYLLPFLLYLPLIQKILFLFLLIILSYFLHLLIIYLQLLCLLIKLNFIQWFLMISSSCFLCPLLLMKILNSFLPIFNIHFHQYFFLLIIKFLVQLMRIALINFKYYLMIINFLYCLDLISSQLCCQHLLLAIQFILINFWL